MTEKQAKVAVGCTVCILALIFAFPMWVYVIRSVLLRGGATDFEWFVFYAYCAAHVGLGIIGCIFKAIFEVE
jgi:hypothetical protein